MSESHKSSSRKRHRSSSRSESDSHRRKKESKRNSSDSETLSQILNSVKDMRDQFVALSERVKTIESQCNQQPLEALHAVEDSVVDADRLSVTTSQAEENDLLNNNDICENPNSDGLDETSLAGSVPPLDDLVSPVVDVKSKNTQVGTGETSTGAMSTTGFFDPEQTTARRWAPSDVFGAFLEKNFRRRINTDQVNEIIGVYSPPDTDACVAPLLDKSILHYIPSNRKKFVEQRDKDLVLIQ